MKTAILFIFKLLLLLVLPFIFLIRGAVFLHENYAWHPHLAIIGGGIATLLLLLIYFTWFYGRVTGRWGNARSFRIRAGLAVALIVAYCMHGLLFFNDKHAKSDAVHSEYTSLHPILRLSISTIVFLDRDLLITDASRLPEDYRKMGLKKKAHSLHYAQSNGYTHAFDLRTRQHSEFRNQALALYFKMMGLRTLRHGGTADHLHISLMSHDRPGAL